MASGYVIPPTTGQVSTITDAMLVSTSVPETPPAAYNGATTYALDAQVSIAGTGNAKEVYVSIQAPGNTGHAPASSPLWWRHLGTTYPVYVAGTYALNDRVIDAVAHLEYLSLAGSNTAALSDDTKWALQGPTNRWRSLDLTSSTGTTAPSPLIYTIAPGKRVDAFGLSGLVADSFTVTVDDGSVIYTYTESLSRRVVLGWLDWLTKPFTFKEASSRNDLPLASGAEVTITFTRATGDVTVGAIFVNRSVEFGDVEVEPTDGAQNYSTFSRDVAGTATDFIPRRVIPLIRMTAFADAGRVPELRAVRKLLRATPAFWVGLPDSSNPYFESVQTVGVWKSFEITPGHPDARVDLALEEA
jgi:hypothetical protein